MADIEDSEEQLYLQIQSDFVYFWCKEYGLPDIVGLYMDRKRIKDGDGIVSLAQKGIERKVLSSAEMNLLQGALHQYMLHRSVVDEIIEEKATARRSEMLKRANLALKSGKSLEELELARKIIVRVTLQQEAAGQLEMTPEGTPRHLPLLQKKNQNEKSEKPVRSLADRIMRRREKLGLYDRSISAPINEDEEHFYLNNKKSSMSSPSNLGYYHEVTESESRLKSDSRSKFSTNSPLPGIGHHPQDPDEILYLENGIEEPNNNKPKKKKKKKSKRKRAETESPKAFVTVECETHDNYRPRSSSNPEQMKNSTALKKRAHRLKPLNDHNANDIDTIELA